MFVKKLFLPGEFDAAYIYMQKLLLFNADGGFFFVDLEQVVRELEKNLSPELMSIPTYLFAQNDWLASESFKTLLNNQSVRSEFERLLGLMPDEIFLDPELIKHVRDFSIGDLLDVTVYNRRLYLGTDNGLYHVDLNWERHEIVAEAGAEKRHDALCTQVNARYSSVTISCGDDGLFTTFNEFGRLGQQYRYSQRDWYQSQEKSLRTSWLFDNLVNYASPAEPILLQIIRSDRQVQGNYDESREQIAVGFSGEPQPLSYLIEGLSSADGSYRKEFIFLYNIFATFYAQTRERSLLTFKVRKTKGLGNHLELAGSQKQIRESIDQVLEVRRAQRHVIFELYDSVQSLIGNELIELVAGEAISIKSFPNSRRFQNLITVVTEDGVHLISLLDGASFS